MASKKDRRDSELRSRKPHIQLRRIFQEFFEPLLPNIPGIRKGPKGQHPAPEEVRHKAQNNEMQRTRRLIIDSYMRAFDEAEDWESLPDTDGWQMFSKAARHMQDILAAAGVEETHICRECGDKFRRADRHGNQWYCSDACGNTSRNRQDLIRAKANNERRKDATEQIARSPPLSGAEDRPRKDGVLSTKLQTETKIHGGRKSLDL